MPRVTDPALLGQLNGGGPVRVGPTNPNANLSREQFDFQRQKDARDHADRVADRNVTLTGREMDRQNRTQDRVAALRNEFYKRPNTQKYINSISNFASILSGKSSPAEDLNVTYTFAKLMDPDSAVREGETAMVVGASPYASQLVGMLQKQLEGRGQFTPEFRNQLINTLRRRIGEYNRGYIEERRRYSDLARQAGLDPNLVIGPHAGQPYRQLEEKFIGRPVRDLDRNYQPIMPKPKPSKPKTLRDSRQQSSAWKVERVN